METGLQRSAAAAAANDDDDCWIDDVLPGRRRGS